MRTASGASDYGDAAAFGFAHVGSVGRSTRSDFPRSASANDAPRSRRPLLRAQAANLLSASRFVLAAAWLAAFISGDRSAGLLGPIAVSGAFSDLADGPVARRTRSACRFGQWLDSFADIVFVLTALACEAHAGAIPVYIPALIAVSFTQYATDSLMISRASALIKSRLGHWGGIINFAQVIILAFAAPARWPAILLRDGAPLIALFYLAAILERALSYRLIGACVSSARIVRQSRT